MKKRILGIVLVLLILLGLGLGVKCFLKDDDITSSEKKFKEEYESVNGLKWESNGYSGEYLAISIPRHNLIKYATDDNILDLVSKGTQVIYFGNAKCNWCRSAIPVLIDAALEYSLNEIYYYDFFALRDAYQLGEDKEKVALYEALIDKIGEFIKNTFASDTKVAGKKRLSAPSVLIVSSGKPVDFHYKTVDSHLDYNKDLNNDEKKELKQIYLKMFKNLVYVCDGEC